MCVYSRETCGGVSLILKLIIAYYRSCYQNLLRLGWPLLSCDTLPFVTQDWLFAMSMWEPNWLQPLRWLKERSRRRNVDLMFARGQPASSKGSGSTWMMMFGESIEVFVSPRQLLQNKSNLYSTVLQCSFVLPPLIFNRATCIVGTSRDVDEIRRSYWQFWRCLAFEQSHARISAITFFFPHFWRPLEMLRPMSPNISKHLKTLQFPAMFRRVVPVATGPQIPPFHRHYCRMARVQASAARILRRSGDWAAWWPICSQSSVWEAEKLHIVFTIRSP